MQTHFAIVAMLAILTGCTGRGDRTTSRRGSPRRDTCFTLARTCDGAWHGACSRVA